MKMSAAARQLLEQFHALPPEDRCEVSVEIRNELPDYGDLSEDERVEITAELFRMYDEAEAADGKATY